MRLVILNKDGGPSTLLRCVGPRKELLWKPQASAACTPTACVSVGAAGMLGRKRTVADAVKEGTPLLRA